MATTIKLSDLRTDGLQVREEIDPATVADYADAMRSGGSFPPVIVFHDGAAYWLADGFHRAEARKQIGADTIEADVRDGDRRAALLYAVGANAAHGLRRSNVDKRRAVEALLADPEWSKWSNREIAKAAGVTHPFVAKVREEINLLPIEIAANDLRAITGETFEHIEQCTDVAELIEIRDNAEEAARLAGRLRERTERSLAALPTGNGYHFPKLPKMPPTYPVADVWPMCSTELIYSIAYSMERRGSYGEGFPPIIMIDGAILDGRARWLACKIAGVEPVTEEWTPRSPTDTPWATSWSLNGLRGHFTESQRAMMHAEMELAIEKGRSVRVRRGDL